MRWGPPTWAALLVALGAAVAVGDPGPAATGTSGGPAVAALDRLDAPAGLHSQLLERYRADRDAHPPVAHVLGRADWMPAALAGIQVAESLSPSLGPVTGLALAVRRDDGAPAASPALIRLAAERARTEAAGAVDNALASLSPLAVTEPFPALRGQLPPPVSGTLEAGFGPQPRVTTATDVRHPGLTFAVSSGSPVRSVARGLVSYAGPAPGFGQVVVVEHGGGYETVYAELDELAVQPGQAVSAGAVLGRTGQSAPDAGTRVYFELCHLGDPLDPTDWLSPR